jgi:hypothetical protein
MTFDYFNRKRLPTTWIYHGDPSVNKSLPFFSYGVNILSIIKQSRFKSERESIVCLPYAITIDLIHRSGARFSAFLSFQVIWELLNSNEIFPNHRWLGYQR